MDIKVNSQEWMALSDDDKGRIKAIIQSHFPDTQSFKPLGTVDKAETKIQGLDRLAFNLTNPLCTAACGVAEAAAVAACSALSGGVAIAVCVAAAHEAGNYCRSKC